jgi:hypothetical protein
MAAHSLPDWDALRSLHHTLDKELAKNSSVQGGDDEIKSDVSGISVRSQARRQEIEERRRLRAAEEERLRLEEEAELLAADVKSTRSANERLPRQPSQPRSDAEVKDDTLSIAQRRLRAIDEERAALARAIAMLELDDKARTSSPPTHHHSLLSPRRTGVISVKVKATPPRPWKGVFDFSEQNSWIRTATGYLVSIGLQVDDYLDPSSLAFHLVRELMSSDAPSGSGGISPQRWFDLRHDREPWECAADVFAEVRRHWVDPRAAERSIIQFRAAKQGLMRASEFGALVSSLAAACFTRRFGDADKQEVFLAGLVPDTRAYVEMQVRQRVRESRSTDFQTLVDIAADRDAINLFSPSSSSPSTSSKKAVSAPSLTVLSPSMSTTTNSADRPKAPWIALAKEWQAKFPVASKGDWFRPSTRSVPSFVRCYNCSKCAGHLSFSCPSPRVAPTLDLVIAPLKLSPSIPLPVITEATEESGKDDGK